MIRMDKKMTDTGALGIKIRGLRWAIVVSVFLSALKAAGAFLASSTALLASSLDSLMDVGISSVNYLSPRGVFSFLRGLILRKPACRRACPLPGIDIPGSEILAGGQEGRPKDLINEILRFGPLCEPSLRMKGRKTPRPLNYLSVRKGAEPPDETHTYGHEKIEGLASYTQGMVILVFAFIILAKTFQETAVNHVVFHSQMALLVVIIASFMNLILTFVLQRAEKKTGSLILQTEKAHYLMDIYSYVLIFFALLLTRWTGWSGWDVVTGFILAVYVAYLAARILYQAGNELVDRSLSKNVLDEIHNEIKTHPGILGYHELRTRKVGSKCFIDFHLVLKPDQTFEEAHEITEALIDKLRARFGDADITIHEDPEGGR